VQSELQDYAHSLGKKLVKACSISEIEDVNNATQRQEWAQAKVDEALSGGWDGANVDYEGHDPRLTDGYNQAVIELCNAFHAALPGSEVSIDAPFYPSYEFRNYGYAEIASACDYLFVMAYDGEFWDNVQCAAPSAAANCSMGTASLQMCELGVQQYLALGVPPEKLYLGLPWYGLLYEYVAGIPFFDGQKTYAQVQAIMAAAGDKGTLTFNERESVWRFKCGGFCVEGKRATEVWFDDPVSLAPKYALAATYGLKGVGMWEATHVDYTPEGQADADAMWAAVCPAV